MSELRYCATARMHAAAKDAASSSSSRFASGGWKAVLEPIIENTHGQLKPERAPFPWPFALEADRPAVSFDRVFYDAETQAEAAVGTNHRLAAAGAGSGRRASRRDTSAPRIAAATAAATRCIIRGTLTSEAPEEAAEQPLLARLLLLLSRLLLPRRCASEACVVVVSKLTEGLEEESLHLFGDPNAVIPHREPDHSFLAARGYRDTRRIKRDGRRVAWGDHARGSPRYVVLVMR